MVLATAVFNMSSCLKDSQWYVNVSQGVPLVELPLEARNLPGNLVTEAPSRLRWRLIQLLLQLTTRRMAWARLVTRRILCCHLPIIPYPVTKW